MSRSPVVLGVGLAGEGTPALEWAADEARARRAPLVLVPAWRTEQLFPWDGDADREMAAATRRAARRTLAVTAARAHERHPDLRVTCSEAEGPAADVILHESQRASLTVMGSRRLEDTSSAVLGPVAAEVAAQASRPVVVVAGPAPSPADACDVAVGLDGSDLADDLLAFGFDFAAHHGRTVQATVCWNPVELPAAMTHLDRSGPVQVEQWLAERLDPWRRRYPMVPVRHGVVRADPVEGLVAASRSRELLVVGARDRPPARHARLARSLGSVTQAVLHHAACPVAVIHPAGRP